MDKEEFLIGQRRRYTDVLIIQVLSVAGIAYNIILKFWIINATIFTEEKFVIGGLHLPLLDFFLCICLIAVWKSALYHCTVHVIVDIFLCGKILSACWRWHLPSREDLNSNKFSQVSPHLINISDTPVHQIMNFGNNSCVYGLVDTTSLGENKDAVTNNWYLYYILKEKRMKGWSVCLPLQ